MPSCPMVDMSTVSVHSSTPHRLQGVVSLKTTHNYGGEKPCSQKYPGLDWTWPVSGPRAGGEGPTPRHAPKEL